jgi:hypothetical protein
VARAEPETMSHAEQDAPAVGPESPAGVPSAAASLLLGVATGGRGSRGFTRGLPRLSNAGVQALARAALARETAAPPAEFTTADEVVSALVRESQNEALLRADTVTRAFRYLDKAGIGDMQNVFWRTEQRGGFQRLVEMVEFPPEGTDKPRLRVAVLAWRHRRRASRAMFEVEHRDDLAQLKATDREDFLGWLGMEAGAVTQLHATEGYKKLSQSERDRLDVYVGGGTSLSANAVTELEKLLKDSKKDQSKAATFNKFLHDQKGIAGGVSPTPELRLEHLTELSGPVDVKDFTFASGKADAVRRTLKVGETEVTEIPIFVPKNALPAGTQLPTIDEIVTMIATANAHTRRAIVRVRANPGRNPQDAYWASTKGMAGFRSFMTAGSDGIVDIYPQTGPTAGPDLRTSVEHESGHVVSQKAWGDNTWGPKWAPWREAMRKDGFSTSTYAKSGVADDFAEAWALLMEVEGTEREKEIETLMPARYAILKTLL